MPQQNKNPQTQDLATAVPIAKPAQDEPAGKLKKAFSSLFPGWGDVDLRESVMVGLPATGAAYFTDAALQGAIENTYATRKGTAVIEKYVLPKIRAAKYAILRIMAKDPTIDCAIKMHIANALKSDTVDSVTIVAKEGGKPDKIIEDLNEWARKAAVYRACFARVYDCW